MNEETEKRITTRLAKAMVMICIGDSRPEDLHAVRVSITKVGDGSDVQVVDTEGTRIPWTEVSSIDDE